MRLSRLDVLTWRRDALRATLWPIPTLLVAAGTGLFAITYLIDRAADRGSIALPSWVIAGSADAGRQVLIALAAAVITVAGVVFSITIVALTLASQQFGPRLLRNFIRQMGTQLSLGAFVSTFTFDVLTLGAIGRPGARGEFVPHLSITVALSLVLIDLGVLIFFIHHVTSSIQLPKVIAGIAADFDGAIAARYDGTSAAVPEAGPSVPELQRRLADEGAEVVAQTSGYLQFVGYRRLTRIARQNEAVIGLIHRPGHFVVEGRPLARVWPAGAAPAVARELDRVHVTGPHRTLHQDPVFAIDQLVEIAIRALSPAVNDTFTAITCIDWLADGLCKISSRAAHEDAHRDRSGRVLVIETGLGYERIVNGAYDKIRQAGRGMPAVIIRQLESLARVMEYAVTEDQRRVLLRQAEMILRSSEESIGEPNDLADVRARYEGVLFAAGRGSPARNVTPATSRRRHVTG